uniref:Lipoprotein n=1 Tax=Globodera pallida TaxID=36090 RepID=A0A183CF13_GLOPA
MILTVTLFVALAFSSNCDPSEEGDGTFKFVGTVLPRGNYRIFVRTLPSKEMEAIMQSYDNQIVESKKAWNAHKLISDLKWSRFNDENAYGVLGDGTITDGTKFEIQLDWKKAHDPYLERESDPIFVQIYAVKESKKTSLVERILFNLSSEVEYEFIYGTPRDQIGVQKFLLGHIPNGTANMEKYVSFQSRFFINRMYQVVDTDGNFAIEFAKDGTPLQEFYLSFYKASKMQNKNPKVEAKVFTIEDPSTGSIENLPKIDGREVKEIEVKLFTTYPMTGGGSSSSDRIPLETSNGRYFNFELSESDIQIFDIDANADTKSIDSKKATTLYQKLLPKNEIKTAMKIGPIYLMVKPLNFAPPEKIELFTQKFPYPTLTQMVDNGEDMSRYRYKFGKYEAKNDEFALGGEKEKMVSLYQAYLERTNIKLQKESSPIYKIPDEIDVYKLSLQMVHMKKPLKKN